MFRAEFRFSTAIASLVCLTACGHDEPVVNTDTSPPPSELATTVTAALDPSADPCEDFYRYACGGWLDTTVLAGDATRRTRSFSMAIEANAARLAAIMQDAVANGGSDPDAQRIKLFYGACVDESAIDGSGLAPLAPYLSDIDGAVDVPSLMGVVGRLHRDGISALFGLNTFVLPDGLTALILDQMSFALGEKDAYLRDDATSVSIREAFTAHVARVLELAGDAPATARASAQKVVALDTALAKVALSPAQLRDVVALYHPMDFAGLAQKTPSIPWQPYFYALGVGIPTATINVTVLEYYAELERLLSATPAEDLRAYLRWSLIDASSADLPKAFRDAHFEFYERTLTGRQEPASRAESCTERTRAAISDSVSRAYVDRYFAGDSRSVALTMLESIQTTFREDLLALDWLDAATRQAATEKSLAMTNQIGYPDAWDDFTDLTLAPGEAFANARAAARFALAKKLSQVGNAADRGVWPWDAATVNAASMTTINAMNFPAGILQPPFYSRDYPAAVNQGAIGVIMGHELTHGFDDQGRIFGPDGVPGAYWSDAAVAAFQERAACVKNQFDGYEAQPGLYVNGALTLGENIADLGGVKVSFASFQHQKAASPAAAPLIAGMSDEQVFFIVYAQTWCTVATEAEARQRLLTDPHAPGRFRAIGPLSNTPAFADAFGCQAGDAMVRAERCEVW